MQYTFKGMICFFGSHYLTFFKRVKGKNDTNNSDWILFDDANTEYMQTWQEVIEFSIKASCYPTVLLFEQT